MINIEKVEVIGFEQAIRGMRNPKNSWNRMDSQYDYETGDILGPNDLDLALRLAAGGPVHAKYRRMITVYLDITAPLYWWKEFDTYKVGTIANSCSTMHKIHDKEITLDDFSHELLMNSWAEEGREAIYHDTINDTIHTPLDGLMLIINLLNANRLAYLKTKNMKYWEQMIQLLPSSYNQKRTVMLNYEVLHNIYFSRKNHKLQEWHTLCDWIETLPYKEIITTKMKHHEE